MATAAQCMLLTIYVCSTYNCCYELHEYEMKLLGLEPNPTATTIYGCPYCTSDDVI